MTDTAWAAGLGDCSSSTIEITNSIETNCPYLQTVCRIIETGLQSLHVVHQNVASENNTLVLIVRTDITMMANL